MELLIGWKRCKRKIEGVDLTYEIRPLKRDAFLALLPYIAKAQKLKKELDATPKEEKTTKYEDVAQQSFELQKIVEPFIGDHVRNIKGIKFDNKELEPVMLAQESLLANICVVIVGDLFSISSIKEEEEKNLSKQSDS